MMAFNYSSIIVGCDVRGMNAESVVPDDGCAGTDDDPESAQRSAATVLDPEAYALEAQQWLASGASIVGGRCGTRPKHIRRLREMLGS